MIEMFAARKGMRFGNALGYRYFKDPAQRAASAEEVARRFAARQERSPVRGDYLDRALVLAQERAQESQVFVSARDQLDGGSRSQVPRVRCVPAIETARFVRFGTHQYHQVLKAKFGLCYTPPPCVGVFTDVPCSSSFRPSISAYTLGCSGRKTAPKQELNVACGSFTPRSGSPRSPSPSRRSAYPSSASRRPRPPPRPTRKWTKWHGCPWRSCARPAP